MKKTSFLSVLALVFVCQTMTAEAAAPSQTRQIIDNMLATLAKHTGATFTTTTTERLVGKPTGYNVQTMYTKVNVSPLKVYSKVLSDPNKGTELLYVTGQRDNKVRVNPGKFLPTMTLAPTSGLLAKNQHHTLLTSGFGAVRNIVADGVKRAEEKGKFDDVFKYLGEVNYQNRKCFKVLIDDPSYTYTTAAGQAGENVNAMAKRLLISEYHIMDLNSTKSIDDNVGGKTLKVPSSYAKKTVLYIDEATNLPLYLEMSDERGLFEKYEYMNVTLNPAYKSDEFTEGFSEYKF